jgi:surfactin synthase thioesterase subunit
MTERPIDDMARVIAELAPLVPRDKPFAFFGHSLGAIVSFEIARRLLEDGSGVPEHLFVSACPAPHVSRRPESRAGYSNAEMLEELRGLGGTPLEILDHPDLMEMVMPVMRADFKLADEYVAPKDGHSRFAITAYGGSADAEVPLHKIHAWEHWADGRFASREFDGDHFYLNPHREALIDDLLRRWPARAEARPAAAERAAPAERAAQAERPAPFALAAAL